MNRILCFLLMMTCAHAATVSFDNSTKLTSPTDIKLRADTVNSSGTITTAKGIIQTSSLLSGTVLDWSLSGIRYGSMSADTTYTFSNVTADKSICLYLVANGFQPTFPLAATNWDGGTLPTASASGEDTYIFTYVNGHYHGSFLPALSSGGGSQVWTNDGTFTFLSGQPSPSASGDPGPAFFTRNKDGSWFAGTNITQDIGDPSIYNASYPYVLFMTDSNEPPALTMGWWVVNSENYDYFSAISGNVIEGENAGNSDFTLYAATVDGFTTKIYLNAASPNSTTEFAISTNNVDVFSVDGDGQVTANGFTDSSGTEGQYVAYGSGGRLIATNGLDHADGVASHKSNLAAPTSITFPASGDDWTNPESFNVEVYIDNAGVTGTIVKKNGSQIYSTFVGNIRIGLQPGETFSETYTVGTPSAVYFPF